MLRSTRYETLNLCGTIPQWPVASGLRQRGIGYDPNSGVAYLAA
jgi:hypothetical protein